jgi:Protein of unknown function (DUF3251)
MHRIQAAVLIIGLSCVSLNMNGQAKALSGPQSSAAQQQREIVDLRGQVKELQKKLGELESRVSFFYLLLKDKQDRQDSITLDLSERTYQRVDTDNGFLLVSVEEAVPYLNGYKLLLTIGNPLSASYAGFKAKVKWAKVYDYKQYSPASYEEWQKGVQEKEVPFTDVLESGSWNKIALIVTPATAEQLGYVTLSLTTNAVKLYGK